MGLNLLNMTDMGPKNEKIFDIHTTGANFVTNMTLTSGLIEIKIDGSTLAPTNYYSTGGINRSLGDVEDRTISVYKGGSSGGKSITWLYMYNELVEGVLDVSSLIGLEEMSVAYCDISALIFPTSSRAYSQGVLLQDLNILKSLDLRGLTNLGGDVRIFLNDNLEEIKFPALVNPDNPITYLRLERNNLLALDISSLTTIQGNVVLNQNDSCQSILWPPTTGEITNLSFYQNDLQGTIDLSTLVFNTSNPAQPCFIHGANNYDATGLLLPETSANFGYITFYNCDFIGAIDLTHMTGNIDQASFQQNQISSFKMADSSHPMNSFNVSSNDLTSLDVSNLIFTNCSFIVNGNTDCSSLILPEASCSFTSFNMSRMDVGGVLDVSQHHFAGQFNIYQNEFTGVVWDTDKMLGVTSINLSQNPIVGVLDVSSLVNLTTLDLGTTDISGLILPPGVDLTWLDLAATPYLNGILDISLISSIQNLDIANTDVSVILWPLDTSTKSLTLNVSACNFSGTLDVSMFKNVGSFTVTSNYDLNYLVFPEADEEFTGYGGFRAENCDLIGPLDLSTFTYTYFYIQGSGNDRLEEVIWPIFHRPIGYAQWNDCSLNQQTVDGLLSNLSDYYSVNTPSFNMIVYLQGGHNAVPTDGSLNIDISILEYEFTQAGRSLTITYNT